MRCCGCNNPFTPARKIHRRTGKVEFAMYCKSCSAPKNSRYYYTQDKAYQHQALTESYLGVVEFNSE